MLNVTDDLPQQTIESAIIEKIRLFFDLSAYIPEPNEYGDQCFVQNEVCFVKMAPLIELQKIKMCDVFQTRKSR